MKSEDLIRNKILNASEKRMLKFGYRKVTMDEVAQDLVMSKNTIYKQFASKEEIAKCLVNRLQQKINSGLDNIEKTEGYPLKVFSHSILFLRKQLGPWFEHFFKEIPTELPHLWEEFLRYRNEKISDIRSLMDSGIKKGIFRKINRSIAVQAYLGALKAIISPKFLEEENLSFDEALNAVLDIWASGILTKKGRKSDD